MGSGTVRSRGVHGRGVMRFDGGGRADRGGKNGNLKNEKNPGNDVVRIC